MNQQHDEKQRSDADHECEDRAPPLPPGRTPREADDPRDCVKRLRFFWIDPEVGDGAIGPITRRVARIYFEAVRGTNAKYKDWLTPIYPAR